jgi:hypothetical protein
MSEIFDNIKKNIIPLHNAFKNQANLFIDTFLDEDSENSYSDDFEKSDTETIYSENFESSDTIDNSDILPSQPIQQSFDDCDKKNKVYSPININNILSINLYNKNTQDKIENITENKLENITENKLENITENNIENNIENKLYDDELLIYNLTILTKIEKNQKLSVSFDSFTTNKINFKLNIDESYFPQFSRWYYSQNREHTMVCIEKIINYTIEQYTYYKNINNIDFLNKYKELLNKTKIGLTNLIYTYENDVKIINKINSILSLITQTIL